MMKSNRILQQEITELRKIRSLYADLERKNKELRELDQVKTDFVATVSHELRTPLTIIKGNIRNLRDGVAGSLTEKQTKTIEATNRGIDRLSQLINNLLDLSRLESKRTKINRRPLDLAPLLMEAAANFTEQARERGIEIRTDVPHELLSVYADPDLVIQVLHNLISNAIRFAQKKITLAVSREDSILRVTVADDGCGIPKELQKQLFNKFVQLNRPTGGGYYKGTGLGLAICREIVAHHGGKIWVDSSRSGGAEFHFTLPIHSGLSEFHVTLKEFMTNADITQSPLSLLAIMLKCGEKGEKTLFFSQWEEKLYREVLRRADRLFHFDGSTYLLILADTTHQGALALSERIRRISQEIDCICFGVASYPGDTKNYLDLEALALKSLKKKIVIPNTP
ncbi:MAG: hypothetical protein HYT77_08385 [Deltaproteobacteria bacterium]|nr:hypothetical protein [Deltaproteobacteria bacterium]